MINILKTYIERVVKLFKRFFSFLISFLKKKNATKVIHSWFVFKLSNPFVNLFFYKKILTCLLSFDLSSVKFFFLRFFHFIILTIVVFFTLLGVYIKGGVSFESAHIMFFYVSLLILVSGSVEYHIRRGFTFYGISFFVILLIIVILFSQIDYLVAKLHLNFPLIGDFFKILGYGKYKPLDPLTVSENLTMSKSDLFFEKVWRVVKYVIREKDED